MSTTTTRTYYTPEDLLAMPDRDLYELVNGNLVERHMGAKSSWVAARCARFLGNHCDEHKLGWILDAEGSYRCFRDAADKVRKPDVSFIRFGRLPNEELPEGYVLIPPDLAVEVISPNDLAYEVAAKVQEYLQAGVRLVWEINPKTRTVFVHRLDGSGSKLGANDELSGEDVVAGFRCFVRDILPSVLVTGTAAAKNE
jgi:Uma2 family endonuclease